MNSVPNEMWAIVVNTFSGVEGLSIERCPVRRPGKNEVLIKMEGMALHPGDLELISGGFGYFDLQPPFIAGLLGSGTVVEVGSGLMGRYLMGKRVQVMSRPLSQESGDGVWSEYALTSADYALPLDKAVDFEQGAAGVPVSALTVMGLIQIAKKGKHKSIIQTAAASTTAQMLAKLAQLEGIKVINVVGREAQVDYLKQKGVTMILDQSDPDFEEKLYEACHEHDVHLAYDAVGGVLTNQLLQAIPTQSTVVIWGKLDEDPAQADMKQLIFQDKEIDNFFISTWLGNKSLPQNLLLWRRAQKLVASGLKADIRSRHPLQDAIEVVKNYQHEMTGGKVLLVPGM